MKNALTVFLVFSLACCTLSTSAKTKKAIIPFRMVGSYMVVEVRINGSSSLQMIVDSGIRSTLITELGSDDSLTLNRGSEYQMTGLGPGEGIKAMRSNGNTLNFGKVQLKDRQVSVLGENVFNLSNHVGTEINGLIGSDFFEGHAVKVNYDSRQITLYEESNYEIPKGYVPITMIRNGYKMYVSLPVTDWDWSIKNVLLLLDTGAEVTAWFRTYGKDPLLVPNKHLHGFIGLGLNGVIEGRLGRINQISLGGYDLINPVVCFPDSASIAQAINISDRDGTIGSQLLNRFNTIYDQAAGKLYIKPNHRFGKPFHYNVAGIELIVNDQILSMPEVCYVRKDSPADKAGIQAGDLIYEINNLSSLKLSINEIKSMLQTSTKNKLRLSVMRNNTTLDFKLNMRSVL